MIDLLPQPSPLIVAATRHAIRAQACRNAALVDDSSRPAWLAVAAAESTRSRSALAEFAAAERRGR